jgi:hypothetical protein
MTAAAAPPASTTRLRALLPTLLDLLIPTAGYFLLHWAGLPDVWALTIAGSATGVNALVNTIRRRRLDALGLLVVAEIAVSVALAAVTRDPRLILARPAVYLAVAGVVNLVSCFAGRPLSYTAATPMATKGNPERAAAYERAWQHSPELRGIHRQLTAWIGLAMLAYAVIRVLIIYSFSTGTAVVGQELPGIALIALVVALIRLRVPRLRRIVDASRPPSPPNPPRPTPTPGQLQPSTTAIAPTTTSRSHHRPREEPNGLTSSQTGAPLPPILARPTHRIPTGAASY